MNLWKKEELLKILYHSPIGAEGTTWGRQPCDGVQCVKRRLSKLEERQLLKLFAPYLFIYLLIRSPFDEHRCSHKFCIKNRILAKFSLELDKDDCIGYLSCNNRKGNV